MLEPAPDSQDQNVEAYELIVRLLDRLVYFVLPLGVLALGGSVVRALWLGWSGLATVQGGLLSIALALLLLRRKLPRRVALAGLAAISITAGLVSLMHHGLASQGFLILCFAAVFVAVCFGRRTALVAMVGFLLASTAVGVLVALGKLPMVPCAPGYLETGKAWLSQVTAFAFFAGITVVCVQAVQDGLLRQAIKLQQVNAELRRAEAEVREREQRYRLLAENMQDMLFVQDLDLNVLYTSPSITSLLGYTQEEARTMRPEDYMTPASLEKLGRDFPEFLERIARGEMTDPPLVQYEYRRKDGSTFIGELRVSIVRDERGRPVSSQGVLRDVTDRYRIEQEKARLEEQLRQSEKLQAIGELAGGVAHDFNNQLTGIMGSADLLRLELDEGSGLSSYVDQILTSARRAADLTSKLLAFARRGRYRSVAMEINELLLEVVAILEHSIDRTIEVRTRLTRSSTVVRGDPSQIQSALLNIALNARDAMTRGGAITFSTEEISLEERTTVGADTILEPGRYVRVAIADTGEGIAPEALPRIFEPFFTTKEAGRGTGMGLAATYGTITAHGGAIDVETAPGQGSTFTLYLPRATPTATTERSEDRPAAAPAGDRGRVLLVEDEPVVRRSVQEMLGRLGYEVMVCERGDEAMERFDALRDSLALVVLDMNLPGLGGREVFDAIRALEPVLPVLICSGHSLEEELRSLLERGHVAYLQKPFKLADLRAAVDKLRAWARSGV